MRVIHNSRSKIKLGQGGFFVFPLIYKKYPKNYARYLKTGTARPKKRTAG